MSRSSLSLTLTLFSILLFSVWLIMHNDSKQNNLTANNGEHVDAYVNQLDFTQFDNQGVIQSHLTTDNAKHFTEHDLLQLQKPHILVYTAEHVPWVIDADSGTSSANHEMVILSGHVSLHQLPDKTHPETLIKTTSLTLYPKKSLAKTDQALTLQQQNTTINGVGVIADFKKGTFEILSQSRGFYAGNHL